jgi:hypothetical protein
MRSTNQATSTRFIGSLQSSIITAISLVMIVVVAALGARSAILVGLRSQPRSCSAF